MKLLEMIANALRWLLDTALAVEVIVVLLFLIVFFIIGTAVTTNKGDNPNSTENKFKVACQAVSGAPVWNGKNWDCIK